MKLNTIQYIILILLIGSDKSIYAVVKTMTGTVLVVR